MPSTRRSLAAALLALAALLASAAVASAAQRYASPSGSGSACSEVAPCGFEEAVTQAAPSDEVIVAPGDYALAATVDDPWAITIRGAAGQPRPRLLFSGDGQWGLRLDDSSTLRDAEVVTDHDMAVFAAGATIDRVVLKGVGTAGNPVANLQSATTMTNSVVIATGAGGKAIVNDTNGGDNTLTLRNVTAIARGSGGIAILALALGTVAQPGSSAIAAVNVIARGGAGGADVKASTNSEGATAASVTLSNSNFAARVTSGTGAAVTAAGASGNQTAAPSFADPAADDYRQAPDSPTIDAGLDDPLNGLAALDGQLRTFGVTDVGADEHQPAPVAVTGEASAVATGGATLAGSLTANAHATTYRFEWGTTAAYGSATASADGGSGLTALAVSAPLTGLQPATTYHYRLVVEGGPAPVHGADRTFTTAAAPPPSGDGSSAAPPVAAQPFGGVLLRSRRLASDGRSVVLSLHCPAGTAGGCRGTVRLTARVRPAGATRAVRVALGGRRFVAAAGGRARVTVKLTRAGRRLLARPVVLPATAQIASRDGAGASKTVRVAVRIRRPALAQKATA